MPGFPRNFDRIVEQCLLMEIQAMNLYTTLANRSEDDEAKRMLRFLAEAEESHVGRLVEIFSEVRKDAETALARVDIVKAFQEEAWRLFKARLTGAGLNENSPADEYLTFAIVAEAHAEAHYDRLSQEDVDPRMKEVFRKLAREEAEHGQHLKRIQRMLRG
jgi:rubrerythrin